MTEIPHPNLVKTQKIWDLVLEDRAAEVLYRTCPRIGESRPIGIRVSRLTYSLRRLKELKSR